MDKIDTPKVGRVGDDRGVLAVIKSTLVLRPAWQVIAAARLVDLGPNGGKQLPTLGIDKRVMIERRREVGPVGGLAGVEVVAVQVVLVEEGLEEVGRLCSGSRRRGR